MARAATAIGDHLREWRLRRRMSQMDLAGEAEVSTRHLSFVETGRSTPSRDMVLRLAEQLEVPVRERNVLLVAAGYAPMFPERALDAPELSTARQAIELLLDAQKPYPAFALDRRSNIVASNRALPQMYVGCAEALLTPPVNVVRLSLHPQGLAPRIVNLPEWRAHMLSRLKRQIELTADPVLIDLLAEVQAYGPAGAPPRAEAHPHGDMVIPLRVRIGEEVVSFFSTTMVFGTAVEVTLSEMALECLFPADAETAAIVARLSQAT
jgi:transcriptional regulator with XRE-family HTH domain